MEKRQKKCNKSNENEITEGNGKKPSVFSCLFLNIRIQG